MKPKKTTQEKFTDWEVGDDYQCQKLLGTGSYSFAFISPYIPRVGI